MYSFWVVNASRRSPSTIVNKFMTIISVKLSKMPSTISKSSCWSMPIYFYHFKTLEPSGTITQNDIKDITDVLQEDFRYKILDRLDQDRKLMLFQHLGFVHCPIREHCPAFPNCMDALIERVISSNEILPSTRLPHKDGQLQLNLVVIGLDYVANDLISKIHLNCNDNGEYIFDGNTYGLSIETINRDNDSFAYDLQGKGELSHNNLF